jgi:catechol 2,3-dioxygenase-like lactoylglutathione lyase family enzyme
VTILRLDHIQLAIPAGGEDKGRAFYAGLLGFEEVEKPANLAGCGGCWFVAGDVRVHLGVAGDFVAASKAHPAFVVDDLSELRKRLETAGCPVVEDEPLEGYDRFYVYDPFGNRIEMMQPLEP